MERRDGVFIARYLIQSIWADQKGQDSSGLADANEKIMRLLEEARPPSQFGHTDTYAEALGWLVSHGDYELIKFIFENGNPPTSSCINQAAGMYYGHYWYSDPPITDFLKQPDQRKRLSFALHYGAPFNNRDLTLMIDEYVKVHRFDYEHSGPHEGDLRRWLQDLEVLASIPIDSRTRRRSYEAIEATCAELKAKRDRTE